MQLYNQTRASLWAHFYWEGVVVIIGGYILLLAASDAVAHFNNSIVAPLAAGNCLGLCFDLALNVFWPGT